MEENKDLYTHLPSLYVMIGVATGISVFIWNKLLQHKNLSPILASLIYHSNIKLIKILSWLTLITYPILVGGLLYFYDAEGIITISFLLWFLLPVCIVGALLRQPVKSEYYEWARKKQMHVVFIMILYILAFLGTL